MVHYECAGCGQCLKVCPTGALSVQLGGSHYYFGKLVEKPTIGDNLRSICAEDIVRANRLLYMTAFFGLVLCSCIAWCVMLCAGVLV